MRNSSLGFTLTDRESNKFSFFFKIITFYDKLLILVASSKNITELINLLKIISKLKRTNIFLTSARSDHCNWPVNHGQTIPIKLSVLGLGFVGDVCLYNRILLGLSVSIIRWVEDFMKTSLRSIRYTLYFVT